MSVTQSELALRLGVSQPVVANALSGKGRVSEEVRQKILSEAQRLGYRANRAAKALATGRSGSVQLWIASLECPYSMRVCAAMQEVVSSEGYDLTILAGRASLSSWPSEGLFLLNPTGVGPQAREALERHIPVIGLGCFHDAAPRGFDYAAVDLKPGAQAALDHLIESGCQRIAFVGLRAPDRSRDEESDPQWEPRFRLYEDTLRRAGLPLERLVGVARYPLRRESRVLVEDYVGRQGAPDALFCNCDDIAIGALWALNRLGVSVPGQVKIIGCDGIAETEDIEPPLSTIAMPIEAMCHEAWRLFKTRRDALDHDASLAPQITHLPAPFVLRTSAQ